MFCVLNSGLSGLGSCSCLDPCALFPGKTLLSHTLTVPHSTAPGPGVLKGTGECSAGG